MENYSVIIQCGQLCYTKAESDPMGHLFGLSWGDF